MTTDDELVPASFTDGPWSRGGLDEDKAPRAVRRGTHELRTVSGLRYIVDKRWVVDGMTVHVSYRVNQETTRLRDAEARYDRLRELAQAVVDADPMGVDTSAFGRAMQALAAALSETEGNE